MTDPAGETASALVKRTCAEQGLPITVVDPVALATIAAVLARSAERQLKDKDIDAKWKARREIDLLRVERNKHV